MIKIKKRIKIYIVLEIIAVVVFYSVMQLFALKR